MLMEVLAQHVHTEKNPEEATFLFLAYHDNEQPLLKVANNSLRCGSNTKGLITLLELLRRLHELSISVCVGNRLQCGVIVACYSK